MNEVTEETLKKAYKPYDVVTDKNGNVGFIQEVGVNYCQVGFDDQISYAVNWLVGSPGYSAWFHHRELTKHTNIFIEIAKSSCHPSGRNSDSVETLFNNF